MTLLGAYQELSAFDQLLHELHVMLCAFATLVACVPLLTTKGSLEHKVAGRIYLPLSLAALFLATGMAWREESLVLFCFNAFCAYLLMSGWRAVHAHEKPSPIDWIIPLSLVILAGFVMSHALFFDEGTRSLYLLFFALNAFYLGWRDVKQLAQRAELNQYRLFLPESLFTRGRGSDWMNRHVAGMVGSVLANLSVIVLTLLPLSLHWLWPTGLIAAGLVIAFQDRRKKRAVRKAMVRVLHPKFRKTVRGDDDEPFRHAA